GLAAVTATLAVFHETRTGVVIGYAALAVVLLATTVVTVIAVDEPTITTRHDALRISPAALLPGFAAIVATACWLALLLVPLGSLWMAVGIVAGAAALVAAFTALREPAIRGFFVAVRDLRARGGVRRPLRAVRRRGLGACLRRAPRPGALIRT